MQPPDQGEQAVAPLSATTLSRVSKVCRNQMTMVARKMTVKALLQEVLGLLPHEQAHALQRTAGGSWAAP